MLPAGVAKISLQLTGNVKKIANKKI